MKTISVAQMRDLDQRASREFGIPALLLMENAGRGASVELLRRFASVLEARGALLVAGAGNNGGDAYVVARHLHNAGVQATLVSAGQPRSEEARLNHDIARALGLRFAPADDPTRWPREPGCVIDGLLGVGITGEVRPPADRLIDAMNRLAPHSAVVALDVPSGLDADAGTAGAHVVSAALTLTFGAIKHGLARPAARPATGEVVLVEISLPRQLLAAVGVT
jgi:NAD(P)H-hydrate epimerase